MVCVLVFSLNPSSLISQVNYTANFEDAASQNLWDNNGFSDTSTGSCAGSSMKDNCFGSGTSQIVEMWNSSSIGTAMGGDLSISFDYVLYDWNTTTAAASSDFKEIKVYLKNTTPTTSSLGTLVHTLSSHSSSASCITESFSATGFSGDTYLAITFEHSEVGSPDTDILFDNLSIVESTCTEPMATYTVVPDCGSAQFTIEVNVTDLGDATAVDISNDAGVAATTNVGTGVTSIGPFSAGTDVVVTIDGTNYGGCAAMASSTQTEACACAMNPTATVATANLDCGTGMYDIQVTVDSDGSGDPNMTDILIDGVVQQADAMIGTMYTFTVATGMRTIEIQAEGSGFVTCENSYMVSETCNGGDTCTDALDITNGCSVGDLTAANIDSGSLVENFISCGNGTTIANCGANSGFTGSSYVRTDHTDIWYAVNPNGADEVTVTISNLMNGNIMILPYLGDGTCPSNNSTLEDNIGNLSQSVTSGTCPFLSADGSITFSGTPLTTASVVYLRIMPWAANGSGATNCETLTYPSFDICTSIPQANDVCGDAIDMDGIAASGDLCAAGTETENNETGASCGESQGTNDLWYEVTMDGGDSDQFLEVDLTFTNATDAVVVGLYSNCFSNTFEECTTVSSTGAGSTVTHAFASTITAGGLGPTWYVRVTPVAGNSVCTFSIQGNRVAENNNCEVMQSPFPGFDVGNTNNDMNFNFASASGAVPVVAGNDLWFQFDPEQASDPVTGLNTASTTAEVVVGGLAAGQEIDILLYTAEGVSSNNCNDLASNYLETLSVTGNGTFELSCLDELHLATDGGYIVRVVQTAGTTIDNGLINVQPQPAGPYNNDCSNIWGGSGPTNLGWTDPTPGANDGINDGGLANNFNPFVIEPGSENYVSGDFENSTDCNPDIASAVCNGVDQQAILSNEDRDLWYIITVPDLTGACDLTMSETINSVTFTYNSGSAFEDAVLYIYDGCTDANLIDCSGALDGASPGTSWTVSGLTQGDSYLVRVKPHDISSNGVNNEFDFDLSWEPSNPTPCNDDPATAESLSVGCFSYSSLETWSAQGATETSPVDGAPESDVWFSFTAPTGNGGTYTSGTPESWVSVFFEEVSGHTLYMDLYNTLSTDAAGRTWDTSSSDQAWGVFGNLNEGQTYYIRLYHKEDPTVNVQYKIAINDGPGVEPGWECGENSASNITSCASGCKDLREVFFKIDLPDDTPGNAYWMIDVTGIDQDLDFELRSKYLNGSTTYVTGTTGTDGAVEGSAADFDHPCSSVALESAVSITSTTTGLVGCDGNDSLGDIDPTLVSQGADGNTDVGSGVRRVYFNMNGAVSGQKDYYYLRVFIDPSDPRYNDWAEVKICDINFKGPYSTAALADVGGTPDLNCDPVTCAISNAAISNDDTCNGDDATFTVTFDVSEGSGNYEVYVTADNADLGITNGDVLATVTAEAMTAIGVSIDVTITGPTTATTLMVNVRDTDTPLCTNTSDLSVMIPDCPNTTNAVDDFNHTPQGVAVMGNVLTNDFDLQGDGQTVNTTITTAPTSGMVTIDALGNYTYTPTDPNFTGEDSFQYEVCDDGAPQACDIATVYIEVLPDPINGNNPPVANPDLGTTEVNTPISGSLIGNDNDIDGDNLVINTTPTSNPTNGTVSINPDGTYTYTPDNGFTGTDSFMYEVCDDGNPSLCDQTTVTITVLPNTGNATSAMDDSGIGLINMDISGSMIANDSDPEGDGQMVNTVPVSNPTNGSVVINMDGTYTYTPNADFTGNDQFVYEICDDHSMSACTQATVYLTVLPDRPNTTNAEDDYNHTPVNTAVSGNVLTNDTDEQGDTQSTNTTITTLPTNGMVSLDAMGNYTYTPNADYTGEDSFQYTVCDDGTPQVCDVATVYIEILPNIGSGNNAVIANPDNNVTNINTPVVGNVTDNDNDPNGDNLTVNTAPTSNPSNGTVMLFSNGSYIYTPDTDFLGTDVFSYEVCDDGTPQSCDVTTVTIEVLANNTNNTYAFDDSGVGTSGNPIIGDLLSNDTDTEGDSQTVNTTPVTNPSNGTVSIFPDGSYTYTPTDPNFSGNDQFIYEVCDDGMPQSCDQATVYLTVLEPLKELDLTIGITAQFTSIDEGASSSLTYNITNLGPDSSDGSLVTIRIFKVGTFGTLNLDPLPLGWMISANTSTYYDITTTNQLATGLLSRTIVTATFTHDGDDEDAVVEFNAFIVPGSGGENVFTNNEDEAQIQVN